MQEEVKDTFSLAVNCIVAALIIAFMVMGVSLRNQMAQARNEQLAQQTRFKESVQYNGYDDALLTGDEIITMIREFYSHEGLEIYLDSDKAGNDLYITTQLSRQDPNLVKIETLRTRIDSSKTADNKKFNTLYKVYLVYDSMDTKLVTEQQTPAPYSLVTGIKILKRNGSGA